MTQDELLREFFLGFVKIHVLHHAAEEPVYGLALIAELRRHGYELSPGTLYPLLHHLEASGYLARLDRVVDGKVRKYYGITRRGVKALSDVRARVAELVEEILGPHRSASRRRKRHRASRTPRPSADGQIR